ncbi:LysE family translocator [Vibrio maerlii]|uniref:LysE family translocator n=1 Tax=Vibrio maerlii TaxID=2231648 RepID=UPI000E3CF3C5|nr:LysE family translocator [Vibrio maerlii]
MSSQLVMAFLLFSCSISIAPGAGNIALLGLSSRYGFRSTLPFIAGSSFGVTVIMAGSLLGLSNILLMYPSVYLTLKFAGISYLFYLAWGLISSNGKASPKKDHQGFLSGVFIQLLNPKVWVGVLTVLTQFLPHERASTMEVTFVFTSFIIIGAVGMCIWAYFGGTLNYVIKSDKYLRWINRSLGCILAAVATFMLIQ